MGITHGYEHSTATLLGTADKKPATSQKKLLKFVKLTPMGRRSSQASACVYSVYMDYFSYNPDFRQSFPVRVSILMIATVFPNCLYARLLKDTKI